MKTTRYFEQQVLRKRPFLKREWCKRVLNNPVYYDVQPDDRIRYWGFILELGCYLRVITLEMAKRYTMPSLIEPLTLKPGA